MAYTSSAIDTRDIAFPATGATIKTPAKTAPRRGLLTRLLDVMMAARMRQAEREVARYLADTGGKFTDEAEREIERRFLATPSRW
ncbi:MAG: hypothetical protein GC182_12615 [Rhodopseudomonas sp.]|nr:hypothetical protein [Rhodopseudomonas sp.]